MRIFDDFLRTTTAKKFTIILTVLVSMSFTVVGQDASAIHELPSVNLRFFEIPTALEINDGLYKWAQERPELLRIEEIGKSTTGFPILLCHFTDNRVPDENKQRVLLTASHPNEISVVSHMLFFARWLLSSDVEANEILKHQNILMLPLISPDEYPIRPRDDHPGVYGGWKWWTGVSNPQSRPEAVALQKVIDTFLPEVHLDLHGFSRNLKGLGFSCSMNYRGAGGGLGRSFLSEIPRLMDKAAEDIGILAVYGDEGDGAITVSAPTGANEHFYSRRGGLVSWVYTYHKSHAISMVLESGYAEHYMASLRALLREGHKIGRWERYPGYAVNQIANELSIAVSAWGDTTAKRRKSRVELWAKKANVNPGVIQPETRGFVSGLVVTDPDLKRRLMLDPDGKVDPHPNATQFFTNFEKESIASQYDINGIQRSLDYLKGFLAPEEIEETLQVPHLVPKVFLREFERVNKPTDDPLIHNGMNIRVFIPFKNAKITEVLLDGRPCHQGGTDGYVVYHKPGTIVEFSIPPGKTKPIHFVGVAYEPQEKRLYGFTREDWNLP